VGRRRAGFRRGRLKVARMSERLPLYMGIGLAAGLGLGLIAHYALGDSSLVQALVANGVEPAGQIFLRLLFMLVLPLVFAALALAVAELGDLRALGRIGAKTLAYTAAVSSIAVGIGVTLVNFFQPGSGLPPELRERLSSSVAPAAAPAAGASGVDFLVHLVPTNIVKAMADGDMLAVMVFSLLLGVALAAVRSESARRLEEALRGLQDVTMWLLALVIRLAPFGVACLVFALAYKIGLEVFHSLAAYVGVVLAGLALQMFVVYSASVWWLGGMSPRVFFRGSRAALITAFSTASSNATLPTALWVAENELNLPSHVGRFVLTLGSTANQNGTALFEGVTVLFLAQFFGVDLSLSQQITVAFICVLGGIGTAGVPAGSIPVIAMILGLVGIPPEGIAIVLGVDRFLDMCRTAVNVGGDLAAAVVVSRGESDPA
jgi:DAACS family dicarboxylate/amino acid:cation (Na+ or H+) symporter